MTDFIVGAGVVTWLYLSLTAWRWDKYESAINRTKASLICCLLFWPFALIAIRERPRKPWLAWEPRPDAVERVAAAEACSLALERDAGLRFDGVFLLPGYGEGAMTTRCLSSGQAPGPGWA